MSERLDYIKRFSNMVIQAANGTGLFPSLFMAQAILESGNGQSTLAKEFNNHFGIKASKDWNGKVIDMNTKEVYNGNEVYIKDGFRWYNSAFDSFKDRVKFLQDNPRYTSNGVFSAKTPEQQADALQKAGYATSPTYANTLKWIINHYNLKSLDQIIVKKNKS